MPDPARARLDLPLLGAALVLNRDDVAAGCMGELHRNGVPREAVRETILQTYLFDGFPTALEGMRLLDRIWPGTADPGERGDIAESGVWLRRGEALHRRIYGEIVSVRVLDHAHALSPELAHWMLVEGYGKVLSRPGLDIASREMAAVAVLAVKERPRQLHSHIRGAIRVGCPAAEVWRLLDVIETTIGRPRLDSARDILARVVAGGSAESRPS